MPRTSAQKANQRRRDLRQAAAWIMAAPDATSAELVAMVRDDVPTGVLADWCRDHNCPTRFVWAFRDLICEPPGRRMQKQEDEQP